MIERALQRKKALLKGVTESTDQAIGIYVLIITTAASYIPGASTIQSTVQGKQKASTSEAKTVDDGKPPTRPANDTQVEEFLKEQYRSRNT